VDLFEKPHEVRVQCQALVDIQSTPPIFWGHYSEQVPTISTIVLSLLRPFLSSLLPSLQRAQIVETTIKATAEFQKFTTTIAAASTRTISHATTVYGFISPPLGGPVDFHTLIVANSFIRTPP
jgi:hypothetical protein